MRQCRVFLLGLLALMVSLSSHANLKKVTLATSVWPPYVMEKDSKERGYAFDIVKEAFEIMGYEVSISVIPWETGKKSVEKGTIDGIFPDYNSKTNHKYFIYSHPFLTGPLVMFENTKKTMIFLPEANNQFAFFNQLKAYRFGVVEGYTNVPAFDENNELNKVAVVDDKANLEQLYRGEVDFILIDSLNAQYILDNELPQQYRDSLKSVGPLLGRMPFYVVFSKKVPNAEILNKDFNVGIKKLQQQKRTYQIMTKYIYDFIDDNAVPKKIERN